MSKHATLVAWEDIPHLTAEQRETILAGVAPYQRDARSRGIPQLGSGAIYQVAESDFVVPPFALPKHWPRCFALDVGWNTTAAVWLALDRDTGTTYAYDELYRGKCEPTIIASAIKQRGAWIPGVIDPASRGRSQVDGRQLLSMYRDDGLDIDPADNAVEAGIYAVWQRLSLGGLKVFAACANLLAEYRVYRRDDKGKVVKQNDHALDALRYGVMSGLDRAIVEPLSRPGARRWCDWQPPAVWAG